MEPREFADALLARFPRSRLSDEQIDVFCQQASRFKLNFELADALYDNCHSVWPSGADLSKHAHRVEAEGKPWQNPHTWNATDCRHCAGEGRIALFTDETRIQLIAPYSSKATMTFRYNHTDLAERFARCVCSAGDAPTLGKGITKWNGSMYFRPAMSIDKRRLVDDDTKEERLAYVKELREKVGNVASTRGMS